MSTVLKSGTDLNLIFKRLSGNPEASQYSDDTAIAGIRRAFVMPPPETEKEELQSSGEKIYAWYEPAGDGKGYICYYTSVRIEAGYSLRNLFYCFRNLIDIGGLEYWDVSNTHILSYAFYGCQSLSDLTPISGWNVGEVTHTDNMFANCEKITSLEPLWAWDTGHIRDAFGMFSYCEGLVDISGIAGWNTSSMENMGELFNGCYRLGSIGPLKDWDIRNISYLASAFKCCSRVADALSLESWGKKVGENAITRNAFFSVHRPRPSWGG